MRDIGMEGLERRGVVIRPGAEGEGAGECFIAIHQGDNVRTYSGIADVVEVEPDDYWSFYSTYGGYNVNVHFNGKMISELRPYDGRMDH